MSEHNPFRFSEEHELAIQNTLQQCKKPDRFKSGRVVFFLRESAREVNEWHENWHSNHEIQGEGATQELKEIAKQLSDAVRALEFASNGVQALFWNALRIRGRQDKNSALLLLTELKTHALDLTIETSRVGGIRKLCEFDLILEVAEQYKVAFDHKPSARNKDEPFFLVMKKIAEFVGMPDGSDMEVGKKIMASAIKSKQIQWSHSDVFKSRRNHGKTN